MGADMIIEWAVFSDPEETRTMVLKRREILLDKADKLTANDMKRSEWSDFQDDYYFEDLEEDVYFDGFKKRVREVIGDFFDSIMSREVAEINGLSVNEGAQPSFVMFLTGGMSWGDSPGEATDTFYRFFRLPDDWLDEVKIGWRFPDSFDTFLKDYGDKLPEDLKKELILFKGALKI